MHTKTMEGLVGARTNINLMNTPMHIYKEARLKGDLETDEYISSEQSGSRPSGLYHMGKDENGNPKVLYDDPKKGSGADKKGQPKGD